MTGSGFSGAQGPPDYEARLLNAVRELARELGRNGDDLQRLGPDSSLERDFGLDSLGRVELLARVQRDFGIQLDGEVFLTVETPHDLIGKMKAAAGVELIAAAEAAETADTGQERAPEDIVTLTGLIDWHASAHGNRVYITLYEDGDRSRDITFRQLKDEAMAVASGLLAHDLAQGERVAIMLPTSREFFAAFYGTLFAGGVPVPLYPPARPSQLEDHVRRIVGIVANSGAVLLVADSRTMLVGRLLRPQCRGLRAILTAGELSTHGIAPLLPRVKTDDIAFLQYTSGSTGNPKGVVLTHANLIANLRAMQYASGVTSSDIFVSWLPLYHDMGLIGACMGSLYAGFRLILFSPLSFLARPSRWLWTIHRHRATVSAAPNFAYEMCASRMQDSEIEGMDLGSWRLAYNGAEPVSPDTIERFADRFSHYGFNRNAMTPVYGLAESSVGLAFPPLGRGPLFDRVDRSGLTLNGIARPAAEDDPLALRVVCCGKALPGHEIRIVNASGMPIPARNVGRVQFKGPSSTSGYFGNSRANEGLFNGDWVNTGDLGYLAAGELYLTGREKDLIIRAGRNIYPQELEEAVSRISGIRKGGVAVFPASDPGSGTERLVVLAETRREVGAERGRIISDINNLAVDLLGMPADDVVLAPPRTVLKTSSGKVRRSACRQMYESGALIRKQHSVWRQVARLASGSAIAEAGQLLGGCAGWLWSAWAWAVFAAIVPCAWIFIVTAPGLGLRRLIAKAGARLALALAGLTPQVSGLRPFSVGGPSVVVSNHASYLDSLVLTAVLPSRFTFVAKQELLKNPFAAIPLRRLSCAFVERFDSARREEDTRVLEARARSGESLVFFAEGTFRRLPGLLPFRLGAFAVAARCSIPVVPVALTGTRTLLRGDDMWPHFSRLGVAAGGALSAEGNDWQAALKLRDKSRSWILDHAGEPDIAS